MVMAADPVGLLDGYQLRLPIYEGPLDVLLRMIERNQLVITDVSLVVVTEQFVDYVATLSNTPPEVLAEFTAIAARLLLLKSRSLLPVPPKAEEDDEVAGLAQQLIAYQAVKAAAEMLRTRESEGWRAWARTPPPLSELPREEVLAPTPISSLIKALRRTVNRATVRPVVHRPAPAITLASMTRRLIVRLGSGRSPLSSLVGRSATRTEYAVAFIALLSLLRQQVIEAEQATLFGEIEIERRAASALADD